ncbi:MAG: hypothetical protein BRC25_03590 [Parcubacteria group bacterium SW_6_46_9]|nr:MAG: hypothetical protein BRC25_03590 [Parcubacteria group bacterium SW_6_46_9]
MAGLNDHHKAAIQEKSSLESAFVEALYTAFTENLNPHLPALTGFVGLIEAAEDKDFGVLNEYNLARLPLSIVGADKVRYRTRIVDLLHESILSQHMSDLTQEKIKDVLKERGLGTLFQCSCGVVVGSCDDVQAYNGSEHHRDMDRLRSAIDADGNPVKIVGSTEQIPVQTMDLHHNGAEKRLFNRIDYLTRSADCGKTDYPWLDKEVGEFVQATQPTERVLA